MGFAVSLKNETLERAWRNSHDGETVRQYVERRLEEIINSDPVNQARANVAIPTQELPKYSGRKVGSKNPKVSTINVIPVGGVRTVGVV